MAMSQIQEHIRLSLKKRHQPDEVSWPPPLLLLAAHAVVRHLVYGGCEYSPGSTGSSFLCSEILAIMDVCGFAAAEVIFRACMQLDSRFTFYHNVRTQDLPNPCIELPSWSRCYPPNYISDVTQPRGKYYWSFCDCDAVKRPHYRQLYYHDRCYERLLWLREKKKKKARKTTAVRDAKPAKRGRRKRL
jgi:hypothetical protein